ncbi:MAG TPA: M20/M25/M40 family metallo-hydrolase [Xanthobacteraceae bacterium]|jgi:acetylornithine deacetylase/succinyl-diaminopimelate desuccinylase-like protein
MPARPVSAPAIAAVDERRILELEQRSIRIASPTFQEGEIADLYAGVMADIGLDVEMMHVVHPQDPAKKSRQPIGRLRGRGGGPTLLLNGHMDPGAEMSGWTVDPLGAQFEDGWIWGMGAHDDKGGCVAAINAVEAIVRSGTRLRGDVLVTPVIAHKLGGAGTRALLDHGVTADLCINMEHSNNTIANVCVGVVMVRFVCTAPELFFRYSTDARAAYINPIEQQAEIVRRIGPSLTPIPHGGWMTFRPHPALPGFPTHTFDVIHKEHYYFRNYTGRSSRECEMTLQFRTVPGQSVASVEQDLTRLLAAIKRDHPSFNCTLEIPAAGTQTSWNQAPMQCPPDHALVRALAEGQSLASGKPAHIGGHGRLGNVGDGNIIQERLGIPTVQYGPGDIRIYKEWPTPDERVLLSDLVTAAKAVAHATVCLCG